jgi:4'-phosphopantetheinyl transferase
MLSSKVLQLQDLFTQMPLFLTKKINKVSTYAVWNITETAAELALLAGSLAPHKNDKKKCEWLATRLLVIHLASQFEIPYAGIAKTTTGKPFLVGHSANISITHSFPMAAAMIHLDAPCGIDIESPRNQLIKIQSKILHLSEYQHKDNALNLCKIWIAKEVLIKICGQTKLSFKNELKVEFIDDHQALGHIMSTEISEHHLMGITPILNYLLAYSL